MLSTRRASTPRALLLLAAAFAIAPPGRGAAQQPAEGFALERLQLAAPGAGWFVLDDIRQQGGLGGGVSLSLGFADRPLEVHPRSGARGLDVVDAQGFMNVGLAVTYDRFRLHASFSSPLYVGGNGGVVDGWRFTAPSAGIERTPDTISDVVVGVDARLLGDPTGAARLGTSVRLILPSGSRADYLSDDTVRAVGLVLLAGESARYQYAAQLGVHVRPLDEAPVPDAPRGSELLFGLAAGARVAVGSRLLVVGPEVFGATALRAPFGADATALEALLTGRYEAADGTGVRLKLGMGAGIHPRFGAAEWRAVVAVEANGALARR